MNTNSENPRVGRAFQAQVKKIAQEYFDKDFIDEVPVPIGHPAKAHRFDIVSSDRSIVIECKCHTWTNGNNVPSAKMAVLNEAVLYMRSIVPGTIKILAMKKDVRKTTSETLASYYCRIYGHLLDDIIVWEVDDDGTVSTVWERQRSTVKLPTDE